MTAGIFIFSAGLMLWYVFYLEAKRRAWLKIPELRSIPMSFDAQGASVIVAFRNELANLPILLHDLLQQKHPAFEVILVNDHSSDGGYEYLKTLHHERIRLFQLEKGKGKKAAIALGVSKASYPLIVFTDADCRMGEDWLSEMVSTFRNPDVQLVSGPVSFVAENTFFKQWMQLEFAALVAVGGASVFQKKPGMCNAANLACRSSVWQETFRLRKDANIDSGDDIFLLHETFRRYPEGVIFLKNSGTMVYTEVPNSLFEFIQQRIRWAGKSKRYTGWSLQFEAFAIFTLHALMMANLIAGVFKTQFLGFGVFLFAVKVWIDWRFFRAILPFFNGDNWRRMFILKELTQLFYVVLLGFLAMFGSSTWKGRKVRT